MHYCVCHSCVSQHPESVCVISWFSPYHRTGSTVSSQLDQPKMGMLPHLPYFAKIITERNETWFSITVAVCSMNQKQNKKPLKILGQWFKLLAGGNINESQHCARNFQRCRALGTCCGRLVLENRGCVCEHWNTQAPGRPLGPHVGAELTVCPLRLHPAETLLVGFCLVS